jgi:hypothetical protein
MVAVFSYKIAEESRTIYNMYNPMNNEIAEQECYATYEEDLKIKMLNVGDEILFHKIHGAENWMLAIGVTVFVLIIAIILTVLEIIKSK